MLVAGEGRFFYEPLYENAGSEAADKQESTGRKRFLAVCRF